MAKFKKKALRLRSGVPLWLSGHLQTPHLLLLKMEL